VVQLEDKLHPKTLEDFSSSVLLERRAAANCCYEKFGGRSMNQREKLQTWLNSQEHLFCHVCGLGVALVIGRHQELDLRVGTLLCRGEHLGRTKALSACPEAEAGKWG